MKVTKKTPNMRNILIAALLAFPAASLAQVTDPAQPPAQQSAQRPAQRPPQKPEQDPAAGIPQNGDTVSAAPETQPKYGYLNYRAVFESMPEYEAAQQSLAEIKAKYDTETRHNEEEFRRMYLDFLQGQKDFPQTIMLKRQKELQNAMERGIQFRSDMAELLKSAQKELEAPILAKLDSTIKIVGEEKGCEFVMNTDAHAFPFIDPTLGEDITEAVRQKLLAIKE